MKKKLIILHQNGGHVVLNLSPCISICGVKTVLLLEIFFFTSHTCKTISARLVQVKFPIPNEVMAVPIIFSHTSCAVL